MRKDRKDRYIHSDGMACPGCGKGPDEMAGDWTCAMIGPPGMPASIRPADYTRRWQCSCGATWVESVSTRRYLGDDRVRGVDDA